MHKRGATFMKNKILKLTVKTKLMKDKIMGVLRDNSGQGAVDVAVVCLLSVVLGALILAGLYALMGDTVMPSLKEKIESMFNYSK